MRKLIPSSIYFILTSFVLLLIVNFVFRLALFLLNANLVLNANTFDILFSFFNRGLLFDVYISLIILIVPFLITSIPFLINAKCNIYFKISNWIIIALAIVNVSISSTDLGFFKYYNSRITKAVFDWTDDLGLMLKIMGNDTTYLPFFIVFIVVVIIYVIIQRKILKNAIISQSVHYNIVSRIFIFIFFLTSIFFGIRGSFDFSRMPLNADDAYFSENPFLNQLSFNPVYTLAHSYTDSKINFFKTDEEAIKTAKHFLNINNTNTPNPFEVQVLGSDSIKPNIIFILMESMSNAMVSRYTYGPITTPFLDSLAENGIVFDNFYSSGIHTYNGIFSSFYGLPAIMHNKPLNSVQTANLKFYGMPNILQDKNYQTNFYITGAKKFDNMNGFLLPNGFDRLIGESNYSADSIFNGWGVTDKIMYHRVIKDCDSLYNSGSSFFMGILTITTHVGYHVPDSYRNKLINKDYPFDLYEYADLLLNEFMESAKTKPWFDNTVFVFVGDHGQNFSAVYDMNLNYHKIPLIIYSPKLFKHVKYDGFGLQIDIFPTLFGLLNYSYTNNSLGVDLFKHKRKYAYFSADNKLGILNNKKFLIYRSRNNISLYDYRAKSITDIYESNLKQADSMLNYGFSMLQSAQYLIENHLTFVTDSIHK